MYLILVLCHNGGQIYGYRRLPNPSCVVNAKSKPTKAKKKITTNSKGKLETQPICNHNIKCFRCLRIKYIVF
jgi:hypothetical protein